VPDENRFDHVIVVTAPDEVKIERYLARVSSSLDEAQRQSVERDARARLAAQISDREKAPLSAFVLDTSETLEDTARVVREIFPKLREAASEGAAGAEQQAGKDGSKPDR
jgi:dephospho-CoA kinase